MKFLIAGLGSVGRRHLRNLLSLGEKDILLFRTLQSTFPDDELAGLPVETNLNAALAKRPDAVIIANPTALHLKVAIPAANAGCHLLLEKPISHSMEGVDLLESALKQGGGNVLVGFQFRFHPGLIQAKRWLDDGQIGRPLSFRAVYGEYLPSMHPWEDYRQSYSARQDLGGGVLLTLCHPLDYARWLLGEVVDVWSFSGKLNDFEMVVEDTAEVGLRFANGVLGSVHLNYNQQPPAHHLEIVGTQGTIRWDNKDGEVSLFQAKSPQRSDEKKDDWLVIRAPRNFERNDLFLAEMSHFLAVMRDEIKPACNLVDGKRALELVLAAQASQHDRQLMQLSF